MKINRIAPENFDKPIVTLSMKDIEVFHLSAREIKHIRRCLRSRMNLYPSVFETDDNLTQGLLNKFLKIGLLDLIRIKNDLIEKKCEIEGCPNTNLERHHQNPVSNGGLNTKENIHIFCGFHHDFIELINRIKRLKETLKILEAKKLEMEKKNNTLIWSPPKKVK